MFALAVCEAEDQGPRMLFEAFAPAARLAVEAGIPLDSARDVLIAALLKAARSRWPDLAERALALGRTTRAIRGLEKRPDPTRDSRGTNVLRRAEALLEIPRTCTQLTCDLPVFEGFESGRVALAALLRAGRAAPLPARRGEQIRYQRTRSTAPPADEAPERVEAATAHLRAVGDAVVADEAQVTRHRISPADREKVEAQIEAFIARRVADLEARARGRPEAVEASVHFGAVERRSPR